VDNKDKICVTYKSGQPNFTSYKRKFDHGFMEIIEPTSREGCCGINVPSKNCFLISDDDYIQVHDEKTYKMNLKIDVPLQESATDDPIEILNIKISNNEKYLAVLAGKNLIKSIEELHSLHIYEIKSNSTFNLISSIELPEEFRYFAVNFDFCKKNPQSTVIFAST